MISLLEIFLSEQKKQPKCIFLAGPAGSGKSYVSKKLLPLSYKVINVDESYEQLLKDSGLGMNQKNFTSDQLSQASRLMGRAQKVTKEKYHQTISNLTNLIIDGTAAYYKPLLKKKEEVENLGYKTLMLMLWVSPLVSLERNQNRDRSLLPSIVLRTWEGVNKNVDIYKKAFGDNSFILINNNPKEANKNYSLELVEPYLKASTAKGKPKTPEQQQKSDEEKLKLNQNIIDLIKHSPRFDTMETAKNKIKQFVK